MSITMHLTEDTMHQPHPFFDRWPQWLRPANDSSMMRWARATSHKRSDFYFFVVTPLLILLSALVGLIALPFLLLSGNLDAQGVYGLIGVPQSMEKDLSPLLGSLAYELWGGYVLIVAWCLCAWLPVRRSLCLALVAMAGVLAVQAWSPSHSLILPYGLAVGWLIDDVIGSKPRLSKLVQVLVVLIAVGVHACLTLGLGQGLARTGGVLLLAVSMLLSTWYYTAEWSRRKLLDNSQAALRAQASAAERERIGRDLHDLLGHTLSLITLKLELSRKLADSDPQRSRKEAFDAETVARQALAQVRAAVTGMRATDLHGEIASAGLLLESRGVSWQAHAPPPLPPGLDTALSLVLREAVTNIARHADASTARLQFVVAGDVLQMIISDDGRGIGTRRGNGLTGMRERVEAVDGVLSIDGGRGIGSQLTVSVPLTVAVEQPA